MQVLRFFAFFVCINITNLVKAQLCAGSLGEPVITNSFGAGPNPGAPLAPLPNLTYTSGPCPLDGFYTVVNSTSGCFSSTWHTLTEDHTPGDVNGYMMVINANATPGTFYTEVVSGLCSGTTYEFASWVMNIANTSSCPADNRLPKLTFNVRAASNNALLGFFNTPDLPKTLTPLWKQFGLFFTMPFGISDVKIEIINNGPGGCGNDLALDDITFRPCGASVQASINIAGNPTSIVACSSDLTYIPLTGSVGFGILTPAYQWQKSADGLVWVDIPGANSLTFNHTPQGEGKFYYRICVADAASISIKTCRIISNTITIEITGSSTAIAGSNSPVCKGDVIKLTSSGGTKHTWTGPNGFSSNLQNPTLPATMAAAGEYKVVIENGSASCNAVKTTTVVVSEVIGNISAAVSICEGGSTTLTAGGGTSFEWSPVAGLSATNIASPIATPAATTTYQVIVGNANGCKDTMTVKVTVDKKPVITVSSNSPGNSICLGSSTVLTATGGNSYSWSPATGLSATNVPNPTASPTTTTTYTVTVGSSTGSTCTISSSIKITVNALPQAAINGNGSICVGGSTTLTASGGTTYQWSPATGLSATNIATPVASPAVTTTYQVLVGNGTGCTDKENFTVTVVKSVTAVTGGDKTICKGDSAIISASGGSSYTWSPAIGLSNPNIAAPKASPPSTQVYEVTVSNGGGCEAKSTVNVTVHAKPVAAISGNSNICENTSTVLTASGGTTYSWSPSTGLSATNTAMVTASPKSTITYTVVVGNGTGCTDTDTKEIVVNKPPVAVVSANATICEGASTTLTASGGTTYSWSPATGLSDANIASPLASPLVTTLYTVKVGNAAGCFNTKTVVVTVKPKPVVNISADVNICEGKSTMLVAGGGATYLWSPATGLSSATISSPIASPATTTLYTVLVTSSNGCSTQETVEVKVNKHPVVTIIGNNNICEGNGTKLTASGGSTYSWSPTTGLSAANIAAPVASPIVTTLYMVVVGNASGCTAQENITINVGKTPVATVSENVSICSGGKTNLQASGGSTYQWFPVSGLSDPRIANPVASPPYTTNYKVVVGNGNGCFDTAKVEVKVGVIPTVDAGTDKIIVEGQSVKLQGKVRGENLNWEWMPPTYMTNANTLNPTVKPPKDMLYTLRATSDRGCAGAEDQVLVKVYKPLRIPNAFSPNGDGTNDTWFIEGIKAFPQVQVSVFDRFGSLVFYSTGYSKDWDGTRSGKPLPIGQYYYVMDLKNFSDPFNGSIFIIR